MAVVHGYGNTVDYLGYLPQAIRVCHALLNLFLRVLKELVKRST